MYIFNKNFLRQVQRFRFQLKFFNFTRETDRETLRTYNNETISHEIIQESCKFLVVSFFVGIRILFSYINFKKQEFERLRIVAHFIPL